MLIIDTHLHFYPCYSSDTFWPSCIKRLNSICEGKDAKYAVFLTEKKEFNYFSELTKSNNGSVILTEEGCSCILNISGHKLFVIGSRQYNTLENLEVLGIGLQLTPSTQLTTRDTISFILENGGIPILNWSPGKWMFSRGAIVKNIIDSSNPQNLLLGVTSILPALFPYPKLIRHGVNLGYKVVFGSDPLPYRPEERYAGGYATAWRDIVLSESRPFQSLKLILDSQGTQVGTRCSILDSGRRLAAALLSKKIYG